MSHTHSANCGCAEEHREVDSRDEFSLFAHIDTPRVRCLNHAAGHGPEACLLPHSRRGQREAWLESDADEQLILFIPFTGSVHLQSLCFASAGDFSPSRVRLFTNRDDVDFAGANDLKPVQTLDVAEDPNGELWHNVRAAKFANVRSLTVFVEENRGADTTQIFYLGLRGRFTELHAGAVEAVYELRPQMADHKAREQLGGRMGM